MKESKFTDAQKAFIMRQGEDGMPVEGICRKAGFSQATYFNWKKRFAGMMPGEMKRPRELEEENARLKRIVTDLSLDKEMLQDVIKQKLWACPHAQAGGRDGGCLGRIDPPGMRAYGDGTQDVSLPIPAPRTGRT
jgi:putative transposase